jgi:gas vesicle protein
LSLSQRATDTANSISALASNKINNAQTAFHSVAENLLSEMQKIQHSTAQLPQTLQATYPDISKTIADLRNTITNPSLPVPEKINRVGREVKERVSPLLEKLTQRIGEIISVLGSKAEEAEDTTKANVHNGRGSASAQ